jgi:thioesterase domain-containing protein
VTAVRKAEEPGPRDDGLDAGAPLAEPGEPTEAQGAAVELGRCDVLRVGRADRPVAVLIAGWRARFVFEPLVERLPDEVGVVVISLYPTTAHDRADLIEDILGCSRYVERVLTSLPAGLAERALALLGYSRSGLVAHEVASRLAAGGREVLVHVFVDTVYPGQEARLGPQVRSRKDTYGTLVRSLRFDLVLKRLRNALVARARRASMRAGRSLLRSAGVPDERVEDPVVLVPIRPLTEDDYAPGPVAHPVLIYRASLSDPSLTTERWSAVVPHLEEVVVEGRHMGEGFVLGRQRIGQIAGDLSRRLGGPDSRPVEAPAGASAIDAAV